MTTLEKMDQVMPLEVWGVVAGLTIGVLLFFIAQAIAKGIQDNFFNHENSSIKSCLPVLYFSLS